MRVFARFAVVALVFAGAAAPGMAPGRAVAAEGQGQGQAQASAPAVAQTYMVFFEPGSAAITPQAGAILEAMVNAARPVEGKTFIVVGHADPAGEAKGAVALANRRAEAVRDNLFAFGLPLGRVFITGFGATKPLVENAEPDARNRRVEIIVQ